jgi:proline iminopeptidase
MTALAADPAFLAGDIEADAAYYRIHFAAAVRRRELLDVLIARLRRGTTPEGIVAARAIEEHLYDQTWRSGTDDLLVRLQRLQVPTLVVHGDADFIPVDCARHIAEAIPGARLEVLDDCGHFAFLDQPERTVATITRFLGAA